MIKIIKKLNFLLLIIILLLNIKSLNGKIVYGDILSFERVLSPEIGKNITLPWGDEKVVRLCNPFGDEKVPIVVSNNIPLGKEVSNDEDFLSMFGNHSFATLLAHFNCKKSEETCIRINTITPQFTSCLLIASIDGYDHVTFNSSLGGVPTNMNSWKVDTVGKFSNYLPKAGRIIVKNDTRQISLGCFEESSKNNLNYVLIHPTKPIDTIDICYKSFSEASEYVLYGLLDCGDASKSSFSISGYVFSDKYYSSNRTNNPPITGQTVYIKQRSGLVYDLDGKPVTQAITDERGFYYFNNIPSGDYQVYIRPSDPTTQFSPITDLNLEDAYTNKATNGSIEAYVFINGSGVVPVSKTNFDDIMLTSVYVIREMNIGILPKNISLIGMIFIDYNANGIMDVDIANTSATDTPFSGVKVQLIDGNRVVREVITGADGLFSFPDVPYISTGYIATIYTPTGYVMTNYPFPPAPSPGEIINLEIVPETELLVGLINNDNYCQDAPLMAIICYANQGYNESHADDPVLITFPSTATKHLYNMPHGTVQHVAAHKDIGSVYGIGIDRNTGDIFTSSFMKYFSGFGPNGTGAIYKSTTKNNNYQSSLYFDLNRAMNQIDYCGTDSHVYPMDNYDEGVEKVGKIAFGDLDIHNGSLYTIALASRELLRVSISDPTDFQLYNIYNPCIDEPDDWRPFALGIRHGNIIIGGVCTMESNPVTKPVGYVMEMGGNIILQIPLDFPRGCKSFGGSFCIPGDYTPWSSVYFDSQPWISDLTMDGENMIISIRDRGGDLDRDVGTYDILRACFNGDQLILENSGSCGGVNGAHLLPSGYFGTPDGINGGEYYNDNFYYPTDNDGHDNVASTAGVVIPGYHTLFGSSLDIDSVGQGTVKVWDNTNGLLLYGIGVYLQNNENPTNNFGKANGLGDMEPICYNYIK
ncbi:hypothetical protein RB653_000897 [Dictyostelium firmibasis]|uniref:SD-repeat containing protein B domain-containing protein n=1 Tax=Dictyostelium firmibasis TaxID=79012 RepID=A0AAN7U6K1_9MYCE